MSQRLNRYFTHSLELRQLTDAARQAAILDQKYRCVAPPSLLRASRALKIERQTLVLEADNAAVAAKLRQLAPQLTQKLRQMGVEVTGIQVKVQVSTPRRNPVSAARTISTAGQQKMNSLAESLPDSPLKTALLRLARRPRDQDR